VGEYKTLSSKLFHKKKEEEEEDKKVVTSLQIELELIKLDICKKPY
jgi:hypothetical protein